MKTFNKESVMQVVQGRTAKLKLTVELLSNGGAVIDNELRFWRYIHIDVAESFLIVAYSVKEAKQLFYEILERLDRKYPGSCFPTDASEDSQKVEIRSGRLLLCGWDITPMQLGFKKPGVLFDPEYLLTVVGQPVSEHMFGE